MNTAQPVRQEVAAEPSAAPPRIFQPEENDGPRDLSKLFNFRRRPGYYNAAAKLALLRRSNDEPHDELLVDFSQREVQVGLKAGGNEVANGDWTWQAAAGGQDLRAEGPWTEVCWYREDENDYLEIELPLTGGWRLERQMLLARDDAFLFLADALLGPNQQAVELNLAHSLPLAPTASFSLANETRDGWLEFAGRRATVVPPALAEWRSEFCHAELSQGADRLKLRQAAVARHLYLPMWIDLDPRRSKRPVTWRRLTVGENLAIVSRDIASAYRIQAGSHQWLIYRSLAPVGNRSVLGHNTFYSFVCSRIMPNGDLKVVVEIE